MNLRWQSTETATPEAPANEGPAVTQTNREFTRTFVWAARHIHAKFCNDNA